jgi:hypothetical protein
MSALMRRSNGAQLGDTQITGESADEIRASFYSVSRRPQTNAISTVAQADGDRDGRPAGPEACGVNLSEGTVQRAEGGT